MPPPEDDDFVSGPPRGVGLNLLAPRNPTVTNVYGDIEGGPFQQHRLSDMQAYLPPVGQIQESVNEQERSRSRGAFWDILALPEKVFFGQAVKGAVRGAGESGFGGAVEGFLRGTPFAFMSDWLFGTQYARETQAADIRRAFGDTSDQQGAANFMLNLAMDVALDPLTLMLNPFGKTAQGLAKAGTARALLSAPAGRALATGGVEAGSAMAIAGAVGANPALRASLEHMLSVPAALAKATDIGDRAAIVLKVPWAKTPFFESNLGFKSIATNLGKGIDTTMSVLRTGPFGDLIRKFVPSANAVADPEANALLNIQKVNAEHAKTAYLAAAEAQLLLGMGRESLDLVMKQSPLVKESMLTLRELGILKMDEQGIFYKLENSELLLAKRNLEYKLTNDAKFNALYQKAVSWDGTNDAARAALDTVYRKYPTMPLPESLLELAGLPKRYGVELPAAAEPLTQAKILGTVGDMASAGTIERGAMAAARVAPIEARQGHLYRTIESAEDLIDPTKATYSPEGFVQGPIKWSPRNRAAYGDLQHAATEGYIIEFPTSTEDVIEGAAYRAKGSYPVPTGASGRPTRIFYDPQFYTTKGAVDDLAKMKAAFPEASFIEVNMDALEDTGKLFPRSAASDVIAAAKARQKQGIMDILALPKNEIGAIEKWLEVSTIGMRDLAMRDALAGLLNASMEFKAGPYVARYLSPEAKEVMNQQLASKIAMVDSSTGLNIGARFMKNRKFDTLLTVEANAIAKEIGIKATGYTPLKDLAAAYAKHGEDGFWGWVFDKPFLKRFGKIDETASEAVEFFRLNPMLNDFERVQAGSRAIGTTTFWNGVFDNLAKNDTGLLDAVENEAMRAKGYVGIVRSTKGSKRITEEGRAVQIEREIGHEAAASYEVAKYHISEDLERRLAAEGASHSQEMARLRRALDVDPKAPRDSFVPEPNDPLSVIHAKNAAKAVQDAEEALRNATINKGVSEAMEATGVGRGTAATTGQIQLTYEEAKAVLKGAKQDYAMVREAIHEQIKEEMRLTGSITESLTGRVKDTRQLLAAQRARGITPAMMDDMIPLVRQMQREGWSAVDEAATTTMKDGRTVLQAMQQTDPHARIHWFKPDEWDAAKAHIKEMAAPDPWRNNPIAKSLDWVKERWAPYTVVNPLFVNTRVRDVVTGMMTLGVGGARNPQAISDAWNLRSAFSAIANGKTTAEKALAGKVFNFPSGPVSALDLFNESIKDGTIQATTMWAGEVVKSAADAAAMNAGKTDFVNIAKDAMSFFFPLKKGTNSAVTRWGMRNAAYLDDWVRLSGKIDGMYRGMDGVSAAQHAAEWTYNASRNLTSFERYTMRRVIPFYSFAKWALDKTIDTYLEKPGVLATLEKIRTGAYVTPPFGGPSIDPAQMDTVLPQFLKDGLGIPYKNTPEGPRFFMFGSYMPAGELNQLVEGIRGMFDPESTNGMLSYIGQKLHPAIKLPVEFLVNRDLFTDRDIEKFPGEHREFMGLTLTGHQYQLARNIRFLTELDRLHIFDREQAGQIVQAAAGEEAVRPLGQREELSPAERFFGSAFGVIPKNYLVDIQEDTRFSRMRAEQKANETKGLLRRRVIEAQGKPAAAADIEPLKETLADQLADDALRKQLMQQYGVNWREQERARKRQDKMALYLLKGQGGGN